MTENQLLKSYIGMVDFLGVALGSQYEILLQDMKNHVLIRVANSYIGVHSEGGSVTSMAREFEEQKVWEHTDFLTNIHCVDIHGHNILASYYFIKENDDLVGILSINMDTTLFGHANSQGSDMITNIASSTTEDPAAQAVESAVDSVIDTYLQNNAITADRLSAKEKQYLISLLIEKDVFRVKGCVKYVSARLMCSTATIYRYIQNCV